MPSSASRSSAATSRDTDIDGDLRRPSGDPASHRRGREDQRLGDRRDRRGDGYDRPRPRLDGEIRPVPRGPVERSRRADRPLQGPRRHRLDRQCDEGRRLDQRDPRRAAEGDQERDRDAARDAGGGPHRIADRRAHRRVEPQALRGDADPRDRARRTGPVAARPHRHRHRPLQALQRHLRPPHRRPGAEARRHDDARGGEDPRRRSPASAARSSRSSFPIRRCSRRARSPTPSARAS